MVSLGISPEYFLDRMGFDEVVALLKADGERKRDEWERTRQQCFYSVAPYSDKIKQPKDLFQLPWDVKKEKKQSQKLSKNQLKNRLKQAEKIIRNG